MRTTKKIALAAALLASAAFGPATVMASQDDNDKDRGRQEQPDRPDRPDRGDQGNQGNQGDQGNLPDMGDRKGGNDNANDNNRGGGANDRSNDRGGANVRRGAGKGPPANFRGQRPEKTFRSAPPNFHGTTGPRTGGNANARGSFHGHSSYEQFTASDREEWRRGSWRHTSHNGRFGWWWFAGDAWFFYDAPIYPFPTVIGYYYDESPYDYYWYWCDDPPGYYPYVRSCYYDWVPVPPSY